MSEIRWLICHWCGNRFEKAGKRGPAPKYCRSSHRQRAYEVRKLDRAYQAGVRETILEALAEED